MTIQDRELKMLLSETCPVRPGQEDRAWVALRERLFPARPSGGLAFLGWLFYPTWRGAVVAALALLLIPVAGHFVAGTLTPVSLATADSQAPGIYATSFYSNPGKAQVVWLNGLEPASDKPTYLDPTSTVAQPEKKEAAQDPNSL